MIKLIPFIIIWVVSNGVSAQSFLYFGSYYNYQQGDTAYVYEANSTLKSKPYSSSKTLRVLSVGDLLIIDSTIEINFDEPFKDTMYYKVKVNGKKGYIQRSSTGIAKFNFPELQTDLLFRFQESEEYGGSMLFFKEIYSDTLLYESIIELSRTPFSIYKTDPRGLDSIQCLIVLDYHAQACGEQGGEDYYTWNPMELKELASLTTVGDAGVFYQVENLIFPNDPEGIEKKIIYQAITWESYDEETEWYAEKIERRTYNWIAGEMQPKFIKDPEEFYGE